MNNEAIIETFGDSCETSADTEKTAALSVHDEIANEAHSDCANGVCVLNWKPQHPTAA